MFGNNANLNQTLSIFAAGPTGYSQAFLDYLKRAGINYSQNKTLSQYTTFQSSVAVSNAVVTHDNFADTASGQYADGEHFLVLGMRVLTGANASLTATPWVQGISDTALLNGRYVFNNNGTTEKIGYTTEFPLSTNLATTEAGVIYLNKPLIWVGQTKLSVQYTFTAATATANLNIRTELFGWKLI